MTESSLISKVWNFANVLRDDGVGYGDYLEQVTYLLFLKMADEISRPPYSKEIQLPRIKNMEDHEIPDGEYCNWETLSKKRGNELEAFYTQMLRSLATEKGILGQIFTKSQNKIQDPAKLLKVIDMISKEQWTMVGADVKGDIYEGLLEKNAADTKSGAGQYFTPRALIKAMVARDKTNLDIFWVKDQSLTNLDNLPEPDVLAAEIVDDIESGLESFREIADTLNT